MIKSELLQYIDREVHIVGASGAEGFAIASYLGNLGFKNLVLHDLRAGEPLKQSFHTAHVALPKKVRETAFQRFMDLPVTFCLGSEYLSGLENADLAFAGQNWFAHPANEPLRQARNRGLNVQFLIQLYFDLSPVPIIAVTGTNGKTTVTSLITHILEHAGYPVLMGGNDRYHPQVLDRLEQLPPSGFLVLEVSNRQLKELKGSPRIAVITNITPDHIEEHGSMAEYVQAKKELFKYQTSRDYAVLNGDDPIVSTWVNDLPGQVIPFSLTERISSGACLREGRFELSISDEFRQLFSIEDVKMPGIHNRANFLAAAAATACAGVPSEQIRTAIAAFSGVRNRIQYVGESRGVRFFDDLASTNPSATLAALTAMEQPVILLAGGSSKGNIDEYASLGDAFQSSVKYLIILKSEIAETLAGLALDIPHRVVDTLDDAMTFLESVIQTGDIVLLSPSGAGFYSRFIAGGRGFKRLVRDLQRRDRNSTRET